MPSYIERVTAREPVRSQVSAGNHIAYAMKGSACPESCKNLCLWLQQAKPLAGFELVRIKLSFLISTISIFTDTALGSRPSDPGLSPSGESNLFIHAVLLQELQVLGSIPRTALFMLHSKFHGSSRSLRLIGPTWVNKLEFQRKIN